jgi:O-antigen/teichoic acid export membrane protein
MKPMPRDIIQIVRNLLLSLGGEGMQSSFHFILNLFLIRVLTTFDFGVFAIAFVLGGVSLNYGNALVSIPATVQIARLKSRGAADYQDVVFGSIALLIAVAIGLVVAAGLWLTTGQPIKALAGGAFVCLWTLRNHVRTVIFARRIMPAATFSDFSYSLSGIVFVALLLWLRQGSPQVTDVLWALAAANAVAITVAFRALGVRPRVSFRASVWQRYRTIRSDVGWSLLGAATWSVQSQALLFLVAAIAGPAAYAPIAAGMVLFSPLRPAIAALINVFRPEFAAALAEGKLGRLRLMMYSLCAIIVLSCLTAGGVVWLGWPYLEAHIFGGKFAQAAMPLIVGLSGLSAIIYFTYYVPLALIQAAGQFKPVALATTFGGAIGLASVSVLLSVTSVAWSLAGMVAGEAACGIYLWIAAQRILRGHPAPFMAQREAPIGAATQLIR